MNKTDSVFVSVVMPAYNAARTIENSIRSVLSQTHANLELLVIDDGSKDDTLSIARAIAAEDSRVRVLENEKNVGVSATRNRGAREAKYDWLALLDSDDAWEENKLEMQLLVMSKHPEAAICFTATAYVDEEGNRSSYVLRTPPKAYRNDILKQNIISCSSVLMRREWLLRYPMPDGTRMHEDLATWYTILTYSPYAVGLNEPLLLYRVSKCGKSGNKLKSAAMHYRTLRYCKVPFFRFVYSYVIYAWRGLHKYMIL